MNLLAANDLIRDIPHEWIYFLVLLLGIGIYMLPTSIAGFTKHPDTIGIAVVFGWSGIGFLLCLIWAFRKPQPSILQIVPPPISQPTSTPSKSTPEKDLLVTESFK